MQYSELEKYFGNTSENLRTAIIANTTSIVAIQIALMGMDLLTEEQLQKAQAIATHAIDQQLAKREEELGKEFDEKFPGMRKTLETFTKLFGLDEDA